MLAEPRVRAKPRAGGCPVSQRGQVVQVDGAELQDLPAVRQGLVLDLRPSASFRAGHVPGAYSFPMSPVDDDLEQSLPQGLPSYLLPARHEPLLVVADEVDLAVAVARSLAARGRWWTGACGAPPACLLTESGAGRPGLWAPPPFLAAWWRLLPPPAAGPVLDLGCGSGRAAVWLALRGWQVTAIDHQPEALDMGRGLASRCGVDVEWRLADLRRPESLPAGPWSAALMFRYLERPLVDRLWTVLEPRAVVMLRTFRHAPGYVGNPQPRHRLQRGEAAGFWTPEQMEVLVHAEDFDADGRPAAGLVARRRPGPLTAGPT